MRDRFLAKVVSTTDTEKAGRVQIRVFGKHDDSNQIPDNDLPWARCVYPVTHAMVNGVTGPTTGLMVGSVVTGYFIDDDEQIAFVDGTLGRSKTKDGGPGDFPKANIGEDVNDVFKTNLFDKSSSSLKSAKIQSIGSMIYNGEKITSMLEKLPNVGGISSAINSLHDALSIVDQIKDAASSADLSQLTSIISSGIEKLGTGTSITDIISTSTGEVFDTVTDAIQTANNGAVFSSAVDQIGGISYRSSKLQFTSVDDALNRLNGNKFVMDNTMKKLDDTLDGLKNGF